MKLIIISVSLVALVAFAIYALRQFISRRERERTIAELEMLPPVKMDFSTPEGAILCLEQTYPKNDIEAGVACHDFETLARVWLQEGYKYDKETLKEMLPGMTKTFEKGYRENNSGSVPGWDVAKSYFLKREPYAEGLVAVSKVAVGPDRSLFRQCILVVETPNGWRVVTPLVKTPQGWKVNTTNNSST